MGELEKRYRPTAFQTERVNTGYKDAGTAKGTSENASLRTFSCREDSCFKEGNLTKY